MLMAASTPLRSALAYGRLREEAAKTAKPILLPHRIVEFQYAATSCGRPCSTPPGGPWCRLMYTNRNVQPMASSQSRSELADNGSDMEEDGEEDEDSEEETSAGQVMFEENLEIIMRAAMNLFRKYSVRGIRAIREILPPEISTGLIAFGVKGAFLIGILWVLKALLEVFCSIATYVFAGLLVVRLAWSMLISAQLADESKWSPRTN